MAVSTGLALAWMLVLLGALVPTLRELAVAVATVSALVLVSYLPAAAVMQPVAAAVVGTVLGVALLAATRPRGLREAWRYLRELT